MALLILFGFVAGAGTALSPCVLPVLPIALSAGATGGRRRPLGIVAGLAVSFTFATVALVYVISALGLPNDLLRKLAIVVLLGFGITLMIPPLAARVEAWMSQFASRVGVAKTEGDGFWSGVAVGASLGLLYAPCAGPILAGVITVSASQSFNAGRLAVALAYGIGSAVVLYVLMIGGRKLIAPLARRGSRPADGDGRGDGRRRPGDARQLRHPLPEHDRRRPAELPRTTRPRALEDTASAQSGARRPARQPQPRRRRQGEPTAPKPKARAPRGEPATCPNYGTAPEFVDNQQWFNTPGDKPLTLKGLRGHVVLVDFWTYSCINCIRTLPYLNAWNKRYAQGRADDRRRPHARVPVRERSEQRRGSDRNRRHRISRRPGQRTGHLERLRQPVLAGRVLHRRQGQRPLRPLRRGRIRRERRGDPRPPRRSRASRSAAARTDVKAIAPSADGDDAGDLPRRRPGRTLHQPDALARAARLHRPGEPARQRIRLRRQVEDRARLGDGRGRGLARPQLRRPPRLPGARLARPRRAG